MISNKPYLLRAFYQWIVDNQCIPLVTINANDPRCLVPKEYIDEDGEITLNVSPDAVRDFKITNKHLEFQASFSSISHFVSAPIGAIRSIYAQENSEGMYFDTEGEGDAEWETESADIEANVPVAPTTKKGASHLTVIK